MIRIAITPAAYEAIAATLPLGSVGYERAPNATGERLIWLEAAVVERLTAMRGPGEGYSDVILRLAHLEATGRLGPCPRSAVSAGSRRARLPQRRLDLIEQRGGLLEALRQSMERAPLNLIGDRCRPKEMNRIGTPKNRPEIAPKF